MRACAALAPEFAGDERGTRELVSALEAPEETDRWFTRHLPRQEGWLHCDLAEALAARASDLEAVLQAALGLATVSNPFTYDRDLAPFVRLAFPHDPTKHTALTPAQRAFLSALLANGHQPFDEALCRSLLGHEASGPGPGPQLRPGRRSLGASLGMPNWAVCTRIQAHGQ